MWNSTPATLRRAIHHETVRSVRDRVAQIRQFITGWNDPLSPFAWTKTAEEILSQQTVKTHQQRPTTVLRRKYV